MSRFGKAFAHLSTTGELAAAAAAAASTAAPPTTTGNDAGTVHFPSSLAILVSPKQRGNELLRHVTNVAFEYNDALPADFLVGPSAGVLFLSVRYHLLHPQYIFQRIRQVGKMFHMRILLVHVDSEVPEGPIQDLSLMCINFEYTLVLAWSTEEAARYLESFKAYEKKPADLLRGETKDDFFSQVTAFLTTIKGVTKPDVVTLLTTFGSIEGISKATTEELSMCHGFGEKKANRVYEAFHTSFLAQS